MTNSSWDSIKFFKKTEDWGDWTKLHVDLILGLDAFRNFVNKPIIIHCAYSISGHSDNSYHYKGMAVDLHVKDLSLVDQFLAVSRFDVFNGIGLYTDWEHPGLHLDIRPLKCRFDYDARWLRAHGVYLPLVAENIKNYCF
jgi:hypothetical protein